MNGLELVTSNCVKFLGIHLDKWSEHITIICKKVNQAYYAISKIKNCKPLHDLLEVYYSMVYTHLSYNAFHWRNAVNKDRVFISEKKLIRKLLGVPQSVNSHFIL